MPQPAARRDAGLGWPAWRRLLLTWIVLAVVMSANGILRELALRPAVGDRVAPVLSALLGMMLLLATTRLLFPPLGGASRRSLLAVGAALVVATVAFETTIGLVVDGRDWRALLGHYALWRGELWPLVLLVLALAPVAWGRWWPPARARPA